MTKKLKSNKKNVGGSCVTVFQHIENKFRWPRTGATLNYNNIIFMCGPFLKIKVNMMLLFSNIRFEK